MEGGRKGGGFGEGERGIEVEERVLRRGIW